MTLPGAVWDFAVCGRGCIGSSGAPKNGITTSGLRFAATLYANGSASARRFSAFADQLERKQTAAEAKLNLGTTSYYRSDYLLHRRPGWSASWKGRSNRTMPSRCVNHDDKMGADSGEGATLVYRSDTAGTEMAGIWPVINWQEYPGVTVQQGNLAPCAWHYIYDHEPTFVGSVSDGTNGAAAQLLHHHNISAKRSWSFGDGGVTTLVTDLRATCSAAQASCSQNATVTTVVNAILEPGAAFLRVGSGKVEQINASAVNAINNTVVLYGGAAAVAWHNYSCYVMRSPSQAELSLEVQAGKLFGNLLRITALPKPASASIFRLSLLHTAGAKMLVDATYTVLPNVAKGACFALDPKVPAGVAVSTVATSAANGTGLSAHVLQNTTSATASVIIFPDANQSDVEVKLDFGSHKLKLKVGTAGAGCLLQLRLNEGAPDSGQWLAVAASNPELSGATVHIYPAKDDTRSGCKLVLPSGEHAGKSVTCILDL